MKLTGEINKLTNDELFTAYAATCNFEREDLHEEINLRVRAEVVKQLDESVVDGFLPDAGRDAILRGFDEAATWHFDAARTGDFEKSVIDAVADYLSDERDVYEQQHSERS